MKRGRNPEQEVRDHPGLRCAPSPSLPLIILLSIDVPDVALATSFYTAAFGLTVGRRFG